MSQELAALKYIEFIFLGSGLQNGDDVVSLKDNKDLTYNFTISELANQHCIPGSKHVQPMRFVIKPLPVNIFSVRNVHESLSVEEVVGPMRDVKREVIVDKNTKRLSISLGVGGALITSVSVIDSCM